MCKYTEDYKSFLRKAFREHETNNRPWRKIRDEHNRTFTEQVSTNAIRLRTLRFACGGYLDTDTKPASWKKDAFSDEKPNNDFARSRKDESQAPTEYMEHDSDGCIEASKIVNSIESLSGDKNKILNMLGYSEKEWELLKWRTSIWDGGKDGQTRYAVKFKLKPITEPSPEDYAEAVVKALKQYVKPLSWNADKKAVTDDLNNSKLMEIPPIELHLGKMASKQTTGEEYSVEIAKQRFFDIFEQVYTRQTQEKCANCLLVIGSDFFNSESDNATSTHKIPQQNCAHYIDLFTEGVNMYLTAIRNLRSLFNKVNVILCAGNHARAMEFFLYVALQQAFKGDNVVSFRENYMETQYFEFGDNVIFFNHGDNELKRLMQSIPAEFGHIWGKHLHRELHLGHLHKEFAVDDASGMITRRIGSPCATDVWHKIKRFVGAQKKHQVFVWDKKIGLLDIFYIPVLA